MKTKYKRHLKSPTAIFALCGSHTSAKKFAFSQWLEFSASERCPKCATVQGMGMSDSQRKRAALSV